MKNRFFNEDDWGTPKWFYDKLDAEYHFDFDPCPLRFEDNGFDGLTCEWGQSNYVNPPYSVTKKRAFVEKAIAEKAKGKLSVFLLPVSTSTQLFHHTIKPNADDIIFLEGRIPFIGVNSKDEFVNWHQENLSGIKAPDGVKHVKASGQQDLMLVIFGKQATDVDKQKMFDNHQESICQMCEDQIIHGKSMTSTFLCEGRFCDEALEVFRESLNA